MDMQNILNKLSVLTNESLTMAGGSHASAELDESPMGRRAPAEPHTCETCGRSMPNWEPGDSHECDECEAGMGPDNSNPDQLDEYLDEGAMCEDSGVSCWGCGQDWRENWSPEDLGSGEDYVDYGVDADDQICPDCAEEVTGGELRESSMCEDCGASPCMCEDPLAEAFYDDEDLDLDLKNGDRVRVKRDGPNSEVFTLSQYEPGARRAWIGDEQGRGWYISPSDLEKVQDDYDEYDDDEFDEDDEDLTEKKLTSAEKRKRETLVKGMKSADWEERYPGRGEEVMYATATKKAKELAESDEAEEVEEAKSCECEGECKCKDKQLDEMRQLAGLTECGDQWMEPLMQEPLIHKPVDLQKSKMTVTTSMDIEAGTKQVTVTAEGDGADELVRVLQMAGINVAPTGNSIVDEVANEPNPQTLDSKSMLLDLSGGPNAPHGQYNPHAARDNSMTMVGEAVDRLASRLKAKFNSQK